MVPKILEMMLVPLEVVLAVAVLAATPLFPSLVALVVLKVGLSVLVTLLVPAVLFLVKLSQVSKELRRHIPHMGELYPGFFPSYYDV